MSEQIRSGPASQRIDDWYRHAISVVDQRVKTLRVDGCPCCSRRDLLAVTTPGHWIGREVFDQLRSRIGLSRCRDCGLVFVNPRPSDEMLSRFYSGDTYSCHAPNDHEATKRKAAAVLDRIERSVPQRGRMLDFGSGGGWLLESARRRGWQPMGYDVGTRSLAACRARGLPVTDRLETLAPKSFDVIVLHHVLEHLTDPVPTLETHQRLYIDIDGMSFYVSRRW